MKRRDVLIASAGLAGSLLPGFLRAQSRPCPPPTFGVQGGQSQTTACVVGNAEADWLLRTGQNPAFPQPGVVWFNDFRSDAEVNAFRWTSGYSGGNDPLARGNGAARCRRIATDGVTGGGCLEILRPAGTSDSVGHWWRPFSPVIGAGNGRGVNDPGANGTLPAQNYVATDGGNQTWDWIFTNRPGWYGHSSYHTGTAFDGSQFYVQLRVKQDPRRTTAGNSQVGKLVFLTTTRFSLTAQEIVTYSGAFPVAGGPNYHRMYVAGSPPLEDLDSLGRPGQQQGSDLANYGAGQYCDVYSSNLRQYCWRFSGGWDTLMYHVTPGRANVRENRIVVYAAHEGETSYTKIWDVIYATDYDTGDSMRRGWNGLLLSTYNNNLNNSEFWHRYDQVIFSKDFIPCPQV